MIRLCIFDLDGTLADTLFSIAHFGNEALEALGGKPIPPEQYRNFIGNGADNLIRRMAAYDFGDCPEEKIRALRREYDAFYAARPAYLVTPYEGIPELLFELAEKGMLLAVNSNKPDDMTRAVVAEVFPKARFSMILGQREGLPRKPDPAAVDEILSALGAKKEECVYIGDSEVDLATAKNAEVAAISATWGFRSREALENAGAKLFADLPSQIPALLAQLSKETE